MTTFMYVNAGKKECKIDFTVVYSLDKFCLYIELNKCLLEKISQDLTDYLTDNLGAP